MRLFKKVVPLFLTLVFIFSVIPVYAGTPSQFDLDVMLVLDTSGSMRRADPDLLSAVASSLFIDMNFGSDSRVGYVMYYSGIRGYRPLSDLLSFSREIKREISAMTYGGHTDIANGIDRALDIFEADTDLSRRRAIILLSDGDINVPAGHWRTQAQATAAMDVAAARAYQMDIPIYVIAFDFDDWENLEMLERIAEASGGFAQTAETASDLPVVMHYIYSHLTEARAISVWQGVATGLPQTVVIPIHDNSIHRAMVTIISSQPVRDIIFINPQGAAGGFTQNSDVGELYTLLTIMNPIMGDWTLTFTGTAGDYVNISLLSIYDMSFVLDLPRTEPGAVGAAYSYAEFSWRLENEAGIDITDEFLIDLLYPQLFLHNLDTGTEYIIDFDAGETLRMLELVPGNYSAYMTLDSHGIIRMSNTHIFTVPPVSELPPVQPPGFRPGRLGVDDTYSVSMMTIFRASATVDLLDFIDVPAGNMITSVTAGGGDWPDFVDWRYDAFDRAILLNARRAGNTEIRVTVIDGLEPETVLTFTIAVRIFNGLIPIIIALAMILLAAALVVIIILVRRPKINDPMSKLYIKMSLPSNSDAETPPEYALVLPAAKGSKSLREIIGMNISISEPYRAAFQGIGWFADRTVISAKSKSLLEIKIPSNAGYTVKVDKQVGKNAVEFNRNGGTEIRIGTSSGGYDDYDEYVIALGSLSSGMGGGPVDYSDGFDIGSTATTASDDSNFW